MEELSLQETQQEVTRLLCEFSKICDQEGLRYYLACGSCLGAIRHKGFIPWDDDADVYMPRADYDKLLQLNPKGENCKILDPQSPNYAWPFGKFVSTTTVFEEYSCNTPDDYGVFIDVFPLDGLPSSPKNAKLYHKFVCALCLIYFFAYIHNADNPDANKSKSTVVKVAKIARLFISQKRYMAMLHRLSTRYDFDSSDFAATHKSQAFRRPEVLPHSLFSEVSYVPFEGHEFKTMNDPEKYLEIKYGEAWKTPKVRKRDHGKAYWRNS